MLVLTRRASERIHIGETIVITVVRIDHDKVRIGIDAPPELEVHREEIYRRIHGTPAVEHGVRRGAAGRDAFEKT
jgi:carbon storage regulator